jgi:hypothetical protein
MGISPKKVKRTPTLIPGSARAPRFGALAPRLGEFGFGCDQRLQGRGNARLEVRRTPEWAWHKRFKLLLRGALGLPLRLCGQHSFLGLSNVARQRQGGGFRHLVLAVKEIRRMMRTEIRFGMPAQGLGFVGGALDHLHGEARAGIFQLSMTNLDNPPAFP